MNNRKEYCVEFKTSVLKCVRDGNSQSAVARQFGISSKTVNTWVLNEKNRGTLERKPRSGRPRKTTPREDKMIVRKSVKDPRLTAPVILADFNQTNTNKIAVSTVKRRLKEAGLNGRRPSKKPLISKKNRIARLKFCKERLHWTEKEWSKVLWSDESKYNLFSSDGIRFVRRPVNERNKVRYQVPTIKHGGGSVMVWGCFSRDCVGPLHRINGIMDRFVYEEILNQHMIQHGRRKMPRGWIFQQDNDPKHTSNHIKEFFRKKKIRVLEWPSQSPDLNPIEHLWEELDRRIRIVNYTKPDDLFIALEREWKNLPIETLMKVVDSMPSRCRAVIDAKGYATKY